MSIYSRLVYGTLVAGGIAAGVISILQDPAVRPYIRAVDEAYIMEMVSERSAALTNSLANHAFTYQVTSNAGWGYYQPTIYRDGTTGGIYVAGGSTNVLCTNWNFIPFSPWGTNENPNPIVGSSPRLANLVQAAVEIERMAPYFVRHLSNGVPIYWDLTNFWTEASIGNGTARFWTAWADTNGNRRYGTVRSGMTSATNMSWMVSTNFLFEMQRACNLMTMTEHRVNSVLVTNYQHEFVFDATNIYGGTTYSEPYVSDPEDISWFSNARNYLLFDYVPSSLFQTLRGLDITKYVSTGFPLLVSGNIYTYNPQLGAIDVLDVEGGKLRVDWDFPIVPNHKVYAIAAHLNYPGTYYLGYNYFLNYKSRLSTTLTNYLILGEMDSNVTAKVLIYHHRFGDVTFQREYEDFIPPSYDGSNIYNNLHCNETNIWEATVSFTGVSTNPLFVGALSSPSLDYIWGGIYDAYFAGEDSVSTGYYVPNVYGAITDKVERAFIIWDYKYK